MKSLLVLALIAFILFAGCTVPAPQGAGANVSHSGGENNTTSGIQNQTNVSANQSGAQNNSLANQTTNNSGQEPVPPVNSDVDNARLGKTYNIKYNDTNYDVAISDIALSDANGHYLLLYFDIKNAGAGVEAFSPDIYAIDSAGAKHAAAKVSGLDAKYSKTLDFSTVLPAGQAASGWVAIPIPKDQNVFDLYFAYADTTPQADLHYIKWSIAA